MSGWVFIWDYNPVSGGIRQELSSGIQDSRIRLLSQGEDYKSEFGWLEACWEHGQPGP